MYFFSEPLSESSLKSIEDLGPTYSEVFGGKNSPNISSSIMLFLNPGVSRGSSFMDNTPEANQVRWVEALLPGAITHAQKLNGTYVCMSKSMRNSLDCLGGLKGNSFLHHPL